MSAGCPPAAHEHRTPTPRRRTHPAAPGGSVLSGDTTRARTHAGAGADAEAAGVEGADGTTAGPAHRRNTRRTDLPWGKRMP